MSIKKLLRGASVSTATEAGKAKPPSRRSKSKLQAFRKDQSGAVAILFGLMMIPTAIMLGGAVDVSRWLHARHDTIKAIDSAVLAAGRILQTSGDIQAALDAANQYYASAVADRMGLKVDTVQFVVTNNNTAITAEGQASIDTSFLKLAGINELPLLNTAETEFSEATLAVGGNAGSHVEVSMMLDVTGSMGGQKLQDMKDAAKDLIDIVVWDDQSEFTARVALAPFSAAVNAGSLGGQVLESGPFSKIVNTLSGNRTFYRASNCASERQGVEGLTDAAPTGANQVGQHYHRYGSSYCYNVQPVTPLSSNKASLKSQIDSYQASGWTAGHLGTAWAWYLMSPNWNNVLPAESQAQSYAMMSQLNENGDPLLRKVAVLMTDGEYNMQYCDGGNNSGVADKNTWTSNWHKANCDSPNGSSVDQARALCQNMKAAGIEVYSVGFQIDPNGTAAETMSLCASSEEHVFSATSGEELKQSFRAIALKISDLYLSK